MNWTQDEVDAYKARREQGKKERIFCAVNNCINPVEVGKDFCMIHRESQLSEAADRTPQAPVPLAPAPPASAKAAPGAYRAEEAEHLLFCQWLNLHGIRYLRCSARRRATLPTGWPDFTLFGPVGKTVFIEFKLPGKKLEPEQEEHQAHLTRVGFPFLVAYSCAEAIEAVRSFFGL